MKKSLGPELAKAINQRAHHLAAQSFASIRTTLEEQARAMLKAGRSLQSLLTGRKQARDRRNNVDTLLIRMASRGSTNG